jgi:hypothetical protein
VGGVRDLKAIIRRVFFSVCFFLPLCALSYEVWGNEYFTLERSSDEGKRIDGLTWEADLVRVQNLNGTESLSVVELNFRVSQRGQEVNFVFKEEVLKATKIEDGFGHYSLLVPVAPEDTKIVKIVRVHADGESGIEELILSPSGASHQTSESQPSLLGLSVGTGYSLIHYHETGKPDLTLHAMTPKMVYRHHLSQKLSFEVSTFLTAYTFSQSDLSDYTARFWGGNYRIGYEAFSHPSWKFHLMAGAYYSTMFVSERHFGYRNVAGPQAFPVIHRKLNQNQTISFYGKYSPIFKGWTLFPLKNREVATGISWSSQVLSRPFSISLDVAQMLLAMEEVSQIEIKTNSVSLSVGLSF